MAPVKGRNKADCDGMKRELCVGTDTWIGRMGFAAVRENDDLIFFVSLWGARVGLFGC